MSFANLFSNRALVKTLSQFFLHPAKSFYQGEFVRETGCVLVQVQRALNRLEKADLISKSREGNRTYYKANRFHPAFEDLKRAFFKTVVFGDSLKEALQPLKNKVFFAFIYGSFARSEEGSESDIDLFIIGTLTMREVSALLGPFIRESNIEINPVVYPLEECKKRWKMNDHFIRQTFENPKIWLIGAEDELRKMVEGGKTPSTSHISRRNRKSVQSHRKRSKRRLHSTAIH